MNAYTRFCATELIGTENVEKLECRGWMIADRGEVEELRRKCERLDQTIDNIIDSKRKDLEITARNLRGIESVQKQIKRGAKYIVVGD